MASETGTRWGRSFPPENSLASRQWRAGAPPSMPWVGVIFSPLLWVCEAPCAQRHPGGVGGGAGASRQPFWLQHSE